MNISLTGKTAFVCGSTQGIGKASALELASNGANIVLLARNEEKLKSVMSELDSSKGQSHNYIVADFTQPEDLQLKVNNYIQQNSSAHILINNTGGPAGGPIFDAQISEFMNAMNQHLICNHVMVQALAPLMEQANYGRIVNVISTSVKQPLDNLGVSNTVRGAVANWSKTMANELGKKNITVNNVLPGATNTDRLNSIAANKSSKTGDSVENILHGMGQQSPMKRIAEPQEVANAIMFLVSPAASYINGINVPVDGGRTKSL